MTGRRLPGHSVIAVPVPPLNSFVKARTALYDPSFLSADPEFCNAHVTLLGPWLDNPTADDLLAVEEVAHHVGSFVATFTEVGEFLDGVINLLPDVPYDFSEITDHLVELFPETPPYGGVHDVVVPHLTLDHRSTGATVASVRAELADVLPVTMRVDRFDLQWWGNDACRVMHSWRLR